MRNNRRVSTDYIRYSNTGTIQTYHTAYYIVRENGYRIDHGELAYNPFAFKL